jgi:tetratricopeptide (TPR) repeat protein
MRYLRGFSVVLLVCFVVGGVFSPALAWQGRDPDVEQEIYDRLGAVDQAAVPIFKQATESLDARNYTDAKDGYEKVLALAPDFPDALRRLSYAEMQLNLIGAALEHAQRALEVAPSAIHKISLAEVLLASDQPANIAQAIALAKEGVVELPKDDKALQVLALAGYLGDDDVALKSASDTLLKLAPEAPNSHYYAGLSLAASEQWGEAEAELLKAKALGFPAEKIDQVLQDSGISEKAHARQATPWSVYLIVGVLAGLFIVMIVFFAFQRNKRRTPASAAK